MFHVILNIFLVWFSEHKVSNFYIIFPDFEEILGALWQHCFQFIAHLPLKVLRYLTPKVVVCTVAVLQVFSYLSLAGVLYAHFVSVSILFKFFNFLCVISY